MNSTENNTTAVAEVAINPAMQAAQDKFVIAAIQASQMKVVNNFAAAFTAVGVVKMLRDALTDQVMNEVFMPLMNTKLGFLTDRTAEQMEKGKCNSLYTVEVVRDCLIDAVSMGLMPTGNQFNILAGRMYPTKEGYSALLNKIGCKYIPEVGLDESEPNAKAAIIPVLMQYSYNGEKNRLLVKATCKKDSYSSLDQLRGKAERKAKKVLYEYLTGQDLGEDGETAATIDVGYTEVDSQQSQFEQAQQQAQQQPPIGRVAQPQAQAQPQGEQQHTAQAQPQAQARQQQRMPGF